MSVNDQIGERVQQLGAWYGDGQDGACPTARQWRQILERPADKAITLINFFKLRKTAHYAAESSRSEEPASGQEAFNRYASVSMPTMERMGGKFLLVGSFEGMFLGADEDWDVIAIGSYPDAASFMGLYTDPGYQTAFQHRTAACQRQKVVICSA